MRQENVYNSFYSVSCLTLTHPTVPPPPLRPLGPHSLSPACLSDTSTHLNAIPIRARDIEGFPLRQLPERERERERERESEGRGAIGMYVYVCVCVCVYVSFLARFASLLLSIPHIEGNIPALNIRVALAILAFWV